MYSNSGTVSESGQKLIAKIFPLAILTMFALFPAILFFLSSSQEDKWTNSLEPDALLQSKFFTLFFGLSLLQLPLSLFIYSTVNKPDSKFPAVSRITVPFAMSELPLLLGFACAFLNQNAYIIAPFLALSLVLWVYFFSRRNERV
ncbi:MAG: hypothetical protein QW568_00970 [Candidatus Anstonellaceae archaeon]